MRLITSKDNPEYKNLRKLSQRKYREEQACFLAEGEKFLDYPESISQVILREDRQHDFPAGLPGVLETLVLPRGLFVQLSSQEHSQGVICLCKLHFSSPDPARDVTIIGEDIRDPGNLGTLLRTMDAAGFDQLILTRGSVDFTNEKCVRATMGSIFHVRVSYMDSASLLKWLESNKISLYATTLDASSRGYRKVKWDTPLALLLGNESRGVSESLLTNAREKVHIPIYGSAESLNVSISAAVLLYHLRSVLEDRSGN